MFPVPVPVSCLACRNFTDTYLASWTDQRRQDHEILVVDVVLALELSLLQNILISGTWHFERDCLNVTAVGDYPPCSRSRTDVCPIRIALHCGSLKERTCLGKARQSSRKDVDVMRLYSVEPSVVEADLNY